MNVLITGAGGQLGKELARTLSEMKNELGQIPEVYRGAEVHAVGRDELDIASRSAVELWFEKYGPYDVVFNCAAFTNVDACETEEDKAFSVNTVGAENLALACSAANGTVLVHVSTDYVFPGNEPGARSEYDPVMPLSAYGRTKLDGERRVQRIAQRAHIVRTAWLYGYTGQNFVHTMLNLGSRLPCVEVVDDQIGNPTNAVDLAFELLNIAQSDSYGLWHATCVGECSWADFAEAIMEESGLSCRVKRCTTRQWNEMHPKSAQRPAFSSLKNTRLEEVLGRKMRSWQEALASFVSHEKEKGSLWLENSSQSAS